MRGADNERKEGATSARTRILSIIRRLHPDVGLLRDVPAEMRSTSDDLLKCANALLDSLDTQKDIDEYAAWPAKTSPPATLTFPAQRKDGTFTSVTIRFNRGGTPHQVLLALEKYVADPFSFVTEMMSRKATREPENSSRGHQSSGDWLNEEIFGKHSQKKAHARPGDVRGPQPDAATRVREEAVQRTKEEAARREAAERRAAEAAQGAQEQRLLTERLAKILATLRDSYGIGISYDEAFGSLFDRNKLRIAETIETALRSLGTDAEDLRGYSFGVESFTNASWIRVSRANKTLVFPINVTLEDATATVTKVRDTAVAERAVESYRGYFEMPFSLASFVESMPRLVTSFLDNLSRAVGPEDRMFLLEPHGFKPRVRLEGGQATTSFALTTTLEYPRVEFIFGLAAPLANMQETVRAACQAVESQIGQEKSASLLRNQQVRSVEKEYGVHFQLFPHEHLDPEYLGVFARAFEQAKKTMPGSLNGLTIEEEENSRLYARLKFLHRVFPPITVEKNGTLKTYCRVDENMILEALRQRQKIGS
jgi:hypothetical protein